MRILLAEDDIVTREALAEVLSTEGYEVILAANGVEALQFWHARRADLVLLDIMMPGASGYEVCRGIRATDPNVPVIFLSAKSEETDVVLGLELGADDFVRKPFGKHELLARVRAVQRRERTAPADVDNAIAFGPWTIQPKRLQAANLDGRVIALSAREVKIAHLLATHRGEVVTKDMLLNECWGMEYFPESRTLEQHVLNLRKKLEADPANPLLIGTVRGLGYRFLAANS